MSLVAGRVPIYAGIGATAVKPPMTARQVLGQIEKARSLGASGFSIFNLDGKTIETLVPEVGQGAERKDEGKGMISGLRPDHFDCWLRLRKIDLQPVLLFDLQQGLGVAAGVVQRVVRVPGLAEILERGEHVLHHALVERTEIVRTVPERILRRENGGNTS